MTDWNTVDPTAVVDAETHNRARDYILDVAPDLVDMLGLTDPR